MTARRPERAMVTAETAVVAPVALALVFLLAWILALGMTQVRLVDAAREGARLVARGEDEDAAAAVVRRLAPAGATVTVTDEPDGTVSVAVRVRSSSPVPFAETVGSRALQATAIAVREPA